MYLMDLDPVDVYPNGFVPYELMDLDTDYLFVWANWV